MNPENLNRKFKSAGDNPKIIQFESQEDNLHYPGVKDIDPRELVEKLNDVLLVDVRMAEEFHGELGHIPGSVHVVLDSLEDHLHELPRNQSIVFACRSGGRSARAALIALESGLQNVYNLKGGMILWNELHLETEI